MTEALPNGDRSSRHGPIVVGIDGTEGGLAAARWAAVLATQFHAPLLLLHARPDAGHMLTEAATALRTAEMTYHHAHSAQFLQEAAEAARAAAPGVAVSTSTLQCAATEGLLDASWSARLLVLGSTSITPAAAIMLGSTTLAVTTHARCPVVIARGSSTATTDAPVVVGVDYSAAGASALEVAFEMAERRHVGVEAVHAYSRLIPLGEAAAPALIDWDAMESAEWLLLTDTVAKIAHRYPEVKFECYMEAHRPAEALLRHSFGAQMVVVGTRRRGPLAGAVFGSTSLNLLQHCRIPLVICRGSQSQQ